MAEILRPNFDKLWASAGSVIEPSELKIEMGWMEEVPPSQWENWIQLRQDQAIKYIFQRGIPAWDAKEEYFAGRSAVLLDGDIYIALRDNVNKSPKTNAADWRAVTKDLTIANISGLQAALNNKADKTVSITGVGGLTGGGTLAANRTIDLSAATKNSLILADGALQKTQNLNDLPNKATARNNLGLGSAATGDVVQGTGNSTTDVMSQKTVTDALNDKADNNDSRLSNAREWTASTVSQAEAEVGTSTTRRAWTAQRVRQAIVAWFNGVSGTIGRTILGRNTAAQVRGDLGLGTAATRDVGTTEDTVAAGDDSRITGALQKSSNLSDVANKATARVNLGLGAAATRNVGTGSGDVMGVGAFGLGTMSPPSVGIAGNSPNHFFNASGIAIPNEWGQGGGVNNENTSGVLIQRDYRPLALFFGNRLELKMSRYNGIAWTPAVTVYHSGNFNPDGLVHTGKLVEWSGGLYETGSLGTPSNPTGAISMPTGYVITGLATAGMGELYSLRARGYQLRV